MGAIKFDTYRLYVIIKVQLISFKARMRALWLLSLYVYSDMVYNFVL